MKFCAYCGGSLSHAIPTGDDRPRHVCSDCGTIHYENPKVIAGCIPVWGERVLLCKRAIEPRYGTWTLPAGFMEMGETLAEAACREAREEANVEVELQPLYTLFSLPHIGAEGRHIELGVRGDAEAVRTAMGEIRVGVTRLGFPWEHRPPLA